MVTMVSGGGLGIYGERRGGHGDYGERGKERQW